MSDKLLVGPSPHILGGKSISSIMWDVVISLVPVSLTAALYFGPRALIMLIVSLFSAVAIEAAFMAIRHGDVKRAAVVYDGSAAVTGLLIALVMPPTAPFWLIVIANAVAILLAKQAYGGIGNNIFNPALVARAFVFMAWPALMTSWSLPLGLDNWLTDLTSGATPLGSAQATHLELFLGNIGGSIGEVSALAILVGALYLFLKGHIDWRIPGGYVGTAALFTFFAKGFALDQVLFQVLAGGLLFGAVFMATDLVTSPTTKSGRLIFGIGCGLITMFVRLAAKAPEGVTYAILLMNALVPLIDRFTVPKTFGQVKS